MSLFHDEQLQFQTDWSPLVAWFAEKARLSGHSVYEHSEIVTIPEVIDDEVAKAASNMAYRAGESVRKIMEE